MGGSISVKVEECAACGKKLVEGDGRYRIDERAGHAVCLSCNGVKATKMRTESMLPDDGSENPRA